MKNRSSQKWILVLPIAVLLVCIICVLEVPFERESASQQFIPSNYTTEELFSKAEELSFRQVSTSDGLGNPEVSTFRDNYTDIAIIYAGLYDDGKWTGGFATCNGKTVSLSENGEVYVNNAPTGVKVDSSIYYEIAEELYVRGVWDGTPMELGEHTIALSNDGGLLVDNQPIRNHYNSALDMPIPVEYDFEYINGNGCYTIIGQKLVKFVRKELVKLPGNTLEFSGINFEQLSDSFTTLTYNSSYDKLFLLLFADSEIDTRTHTYLYVFPDYNKSEIQFVSEVSKTLADAVDFYYEDMSHVWWKLTSSGFVKADNPWSSDAITSEPEHEFIPMRYSKYDLFAKAESLSFVQNKPESRYSLDSNPDVELSSDDYLIIARTYAKLYDDYKWSGTGASYHGKDIHVNSNKEIVVNGVFTKVRTSNGIYYDIARELYLRNEWDGTPMTLGGHTVSLGYRGQLLVDGYIIDPYVSCIDTPPCPDYNVDSSSEYIMGKGQYVIVDQKLVRFFKGQRIELPGDILEFNEVDLDKLLSYGIELHYCEYYDKMFLIFYACDEDYKPPKEPDYIAQDVREFLYVFPDYERSEIEFVSEISECSNFNEFDMFFYKDMSGAWWDFDGSKFVKCDNRPEF